MTKRAGYTLLELIVSMPLVLMLMLGAASAIYVSARTVPDQRSQPYQLLIAAQAVDQLAADMRYATAFSVGTTVEITATVPDRDSNGTAETIRYVWSGNAGEPLYRQVNGSALEAVAPTVQSFAITYRTYVDTVTSKTMVTSIDVALVPQTTSGTVRAVATSRLVNEPQQGP